MNATPACASHGEAGVWHSIDWAKAHRTVRTLQTRIVKAWKAGRYNKVKALQWLLTHSLSGKALAVKRVTENQGKNTPGVDGETWSTPEAKSDAISSLSRRGYHAQPLRRVYIPKANGKKRPLGIATLRDRAMQTLHLQALQPIAETTGDPNSYGFRAERSTADAAERCFMVLARKPSAQYILDADIQACFDEISHDWMLANIPTDRLMLRKWLKAGFIDKGQLFPTTAGTPQGGSISPTLMNMTLDGLEDRLAARFGCNDNPAIRRNKVHIVRYADDSAPRRRGKEAVMVT
jgi:RNA-directed DNA polymerase